MDTTIAWTLDRGGRTELAIYNLLGQRIRRLVSADLEPGHHAARWDGMTDDGYTVTSGVYIAVLSQGGRTESHRLLLLK